MRRITNSTERKEEGEGGGCWGVRTLQRGSLHGVQDGVHEEEEDKGVQSEKEKEREKETFRDLSLVYRLGNGSANVAPTFSV